ncbi:putative choline dehydrogenase [Aureobasidium pullulans]|uniref:Putative choline dehydrogenase n=1 Tax=Aureobasidium pullulans TaxID=5580 RepID=A0A4S9T2X5_AURPU|nr:putative choline dehydrogenase [Aureobasidium pullulans]
MSFLFSAAGLFLTLVSVSQAAPFVYNKNLLPRNSVQATPGAAIYDYVVVGGGTAGLAIAARLSEDGSRSVAVIEAGTYYESFGNTSEIPLFDSSWTGKDPKDTNPNLDWNFVTVPQKGVLGAEIHYPRGKCLGGSSARNYMGYLRSTKGSYQQWADMVGDNSYTYNKWLPYFQKSLDFTPPDMTKRALNATPQYDSSSLGKGGPLSITFPSYAQAMSSWVQKGMQEVGIAVSNGITSGVLMGSSYVIATLQYNQKRESSETAFLTPASSRSNLHIYTNTMAKKVVFSGKKAKGVLASTGSQQYTLLAKREVILSAGAFQSPQVLMVSGIGPAATLSKYKIPVIADLPGVGQNLQDHILMGPSYRVNVITASAMADPAFAAQAADQFKMQQSGILTSPVGDFGGWEKLPAHLRGNFSSATRSILNSLQPDWPEIEFLSMGGYLGYQENGSQPADGYNYATIAIALEAPQSRGSVTISSADTNDAPVIDPGWLTSPVDQEVALAGYRRVREIFATKAIAPALIGQEAFPGLEVSSDADLLQLIKQSVGSVFHASCTCAMGKKGDKNAVVDSNANVIGVTGLRVVDASSFPFLLPGHPMATVYALAEKIAAQILLS